MAQEEEIKMIIARANRIPVWSLPYTYLAIIGIGTSSPSTIYQI